MNTRICAVVIFYTPDKKIFLQDRHGISKSGEEWGFWGGKIEHGETAREAATREIKEELGYDVKKADYLGRAEGLIPIISIVKNINPQEQLVLILEVFVAPYPPEAQFKIQEGDGGKLYTLEEAGKLKMTNPDYEALKLMQNFFNNSSPHRTKK